MSAAKRKGTAWESAIVRALREHGHPHAERRALGGAADRGDVAGLPGVVIEAKASTHLELASWIAELDAEMANDGADLGAVWHKRRGKSSPLDGYVTMPGHVFLRLLAER
ncbi:hypothetical protein [Streptomyces celluloflavus]|uniref:hypothetical protein n=1 Tax=Streptomyces celluloflavus TaxID=58344 RepID=UPI0036AA4ED9